MKIILNEDVYNLGEEGDICDVARGYARNYLFPKNLAVTYSSQNLAILEGRKAAIEKRKDDKRKDALSLKERIDGMEIVIKMNAGNSGRLFGSVTSAMIAEELEKEGIQIEKKKIEVASHTIKMIGTYPIRVKLYESNEAELKLKVVSQSAPGAQTSETPVPRAAAEEKKEAPVEETPVEEALVEETPADEAAAEEEAAVEEETEDSDESEDVAEEEDSEADESGEEETEEKE